MNQFKPPMTDGPAIFQARSEMFEVSTIDRAFPGGYAVEPHEAKVGNMSMERKHSLKQAVQVAALGGVMVAGAVGGAVYAGYGLARSGYNRLRSSSQRLASEASIAVGAREPQPLHDERQPEQG